MKQDYWHQKWAANDIGFHEAEGNPLLKKHLHVLQANDSPRVFVPLCGKTRDIAYLMQVGMQVVGAELSEMAVQQLFEEMNIVPKVEEIDSFLVYSAKDITVFVGDVFQLDPTLLGKVTGVYDRAALVALPQAMRTRYAKHISTITHNAPQLLLTFDYDQSRMQGPPFSVSESHVHELYANDYRITCLDTVTLREKLKGAAAAQCLVFLLESHY